MSFMSLPSSWTNSQDVSSASNAGNVFNPAAFTGMLPGTTPAAITEFWSQFLQPWAAWWQMPTTLWQSARPWSFPWALAPEAGAVTKSVAAAKTTAPAVVKQAVAKPAVPTVQAAAAAPAAAFQSGLSLVQAPATVHKAAVKPLLKVLPKAAVEAVVAKPVRKSAAAQAVKAVKPVLAASPSAVAVFKPMKKTASAVVVTPIKTAARAKPVNTKPDDLTVIEGIGPKIAAKLVDAGIAHFSTLASASTDRLNSILEAAGPRFKLARPDTWAEQANLLAKGEMAAFEKLTTALRAGLRA